MWHYWQIMKWRWSSKNCGDSGSTGYVMTYWQNLVESKYLFYCLRVYRNLHLQCHFIMFIPTFVKVCLRVNIILRYINYVMDRSSLNNFRSGLPKDIFCQSLIIMQISLESHLKFSLLLWHDNANEKGYKCTIFHIF